MICTFEESCEIFVRRTVFQTGQRTSDVWR